MSRPARTRMLALALACCLSACDDNGLDIEFPEPVDSQWWDGFDAHGMNDYVYVLGEYEGDLVAGGLFSTAGGELANGIARWDGGAWSVFGSGMRRDDCGSTGSCRPWVSALTVFGNALIAGGRFTNAGDVPASNIARWDGTSWSALGDGFDDTVFALAVYEGRLLAGGIFTHSGSDATVRHFAEWTGSRWEAFGGGTDGTVRTLVVDGTRLIAGGDFLVAGSQSIAYLAEWDGSGWTGILPRLDGGVQATLRYGESLIAGGDFFRFYANSNWMVLQHIGAWSGGQWSALSGFNDDASALATWRGQLVCGGAFSRADEQVNFLARWDSAQEQWLAFGSGLDRRVTSILEHDDHLYVAGWFRTAGGKTSRYMARWDGD